MENGWNERINRREMGGSAEGGETAGNDVRRAGAGTGTSLLSRSGSSLVADGLGPEVSVDAMRVGTSSGAGRENNTGGCMKARQTPGSGTTDRVVQQRIRRRPSVPGASVSSFDRPRWVTEKAPADGRQGSGTWMGSGVLGSYRAPILTSG